MEIITGKVPKAQKVILYGTEGVGKSTFASHFPRPIFIDTEGSTAHLDVARFPQPRSWEDLIKQVNYVIEKAIKKDYEYQTLVIDTMDWAEDLCIQHICRKYNKKGLAHFGYGEGYIYLEEEFGELLKLLDVLIDAGVNVLGLAHAKIVRFNNPEGEDYDRYELKLEKKTAPLVKEWADALIFANFKIYISSDSNKNTKAQSKGERIMHLNHGASFDAKNRWGITDSYPLDYKYIDEHILKAGEEPGVLKNDIDGADNTEIVEPERKERVLDDDPRIPNEEIEGQTDLDDIGAELKEDPPVIPSELQALMDKDQVTLDEVMRAVYQRGYYPEGTPFANLDDDFVQGVLIGAWNNGLVQMIKDLRQDKVEF